MKLLQLKIGALSLLMLIAFRGYGCDAHTKIIIPNPRRLSRTGYAIAG